MKMIRLPFIRLEYSGSWSRLPWWFKLIFLGALAVPISILAMGFSGGFGFPDSHHAEIAAALANVQAAPAGFWQGLWDGLILPITVIVMFFNEDVLFFSIHNNGLPYWLGYTLMGGALAYNVISGGDE